MVINQSFFFVTIGPSTYKRCGRDFTNQQSGRFKSPSYPKAYPAESHCTWNITVRRGKYVQIVFNNINMKGSN